MLSEMPLHKASEIILSYWFRVLFLVMKYNWFHLIEGCLICSGLLDNNKFPLGSKISRVFIILVSIAAIVYEVTCQIAILKCNKTNVTVLELVGSIRYFLKTGGTFVIFLSFSCQRKTIKWISKSLWKKIVTDKFFSQRDIIAIICLLTSVGNFVVVVVTRTLRILSLSPYTSNAVNFDVRYEELMVIFTRGVPEIIRIFCSAYLGILFTDFSSNVMEPIRMRLSAITPSTSNNLQEIWMVWQLREKAIGLASKMRESVSVAVSCIIVSDILGVVAFVAEALGDNDKYRIWRMWSSFFLYSVSAGCLFFGLLSVENEV